MKKRILISIFVMTMFLCLVGCKNQESSGDNKGIKSLFSSNKTAICTKEEIANNGKKTTETMKITYNNSKILKVDVTVEGEEDPAYIDFIIGMGSMITNKMNEVKGLKAEYKKSGSNKYQILTEIDYEKIDINQLKEILGDQFDEEEELYKLKDVSFEEFKKEALSEYVCK